MGVLFNYSGLSTQLTAIAKSLNQINGTQFNAKFILSVGKGILAINPDSGNYELETTTVVVIKARLIPDKKISENINIGTPFTRMMLTGNLLEPLNYAGEFNNYLHCELLNEGAWLKGKFYPTLSITSNEVESQSLRLALGSQIKGYFEIDGSLSV